MAQLHPKAYEFKRTPGLDFLAGMKEEEEELNRLVAAAKKLEEGQVKGALVRFPVADGQAIYLVASEKPLKLQHVPFFDAWQVDAVTIRGLRLGDVQRMVKRERGLQSLFASKAAT